MIFCECHFIRRGEVEIEHLTFTSLAECLETLLGEYDGENETVLTNFYTIDIERFFLEFRTFFLGV